MLVGYFLYANLLSFEHKHAVIVNNKLTNGVRISYDFYFRSRLLIKSTLHERRVTIYKRFIYYLIHER